MTHSASTMQPRPCQPICTTLPSSTSTGTVRWPPEMSRMRRASVGIGFHVVLDEVVALPFQPLAHFLGVGTACGSEQFKLGHGLSTSSISRMM